jgi:hypothetical protein
MNCHAIAGNQRCHCEPTGPRGVRPEDQLSEAISCREGSSDRDCFVALRTSQ